MEPDGSRTAQDRAYEGDSDFSGFIPKGGNFRIRGLRCFAISSGNSRSGILAPDRKSLSLETACAKAKLVYHLESIQMIWLLDIVNIVGSATEGALRYLEHHHWFFGIIVIGYIFRLHDKSLHARFSALDKRVDEIRKRLACDI
jgi:hypothetical protein